ncbi:MAG: ACP S-malonyltransferase [Gammaproteobacteria bacterium]|nr:ACP S-malonyltransferase [Gammaproteobacteria bacterium]
MSLGFVFPGQGAQAVGMGGEFLDSDPAVRMRFDEANEALGFDLASVMLEGPAERLAETEVTQPALLTVGVALWDAWCDRGGPRPAILAGHSLGEYTALAVSGALSFVDAVRLVHQRGRFMQEAVPVGEGAMAAVLGLEDETVAECCAGTDGVVAPANLNAPGQVVISGAASAVGAAVEACKEAGARRAVLLNVSGPFHCELMHPAAERLRAALDAIEIRPPEIPVVHNVDADVAASPEEIRQKLVDQLDSPVRWRECVLAMRQRGADRLVECGPGNVLAGLVRRIDRSLEVASAGTPAAMEAALA